MIGKSQHTTNCTENKSFWEGGASLADQDTRLVCYGMTTQSQAKHLQSLCLPQSYVACGWGTVPPHDKTHPLDQYCSHLKTSKTCTGCQRIVNRNCLTLSIVLELRHPVILKLSTPCILAVSHFFLFQLNAYNILNIRIYHQLPPTCFGVCFAIFRR
jgi:hypothetical protein